MIHFFLYYTIPIHKNHVKLKGKQQKKKERKMGEKPLCKTYDTIDDLFLYKAVDCIAQFSDLQLFNHNRML